MCRAVNTGRHLTCSERVCCSCTSADITAFFKGMQVVTDGIFLCTHADGRPTGEVQFHII